VRTKTNAPGTGQQEGIVLDSTIVSRDSASWDKSKRFTGGYYYDNYVSALLEEHDHDRVSQGAGRVKGMIRDAASFLGIQRPFRPSAARPYGVKK
jgi:hypothetical protein